MEPTLLAAQQRVDTKQSSGNRADRREKKKRRDSITKEEVDETDVKGKGRKGRKAGPVHSFPCQLNVCVCGWVRVHL